MNKILFNIVIITSLLCCLMAEKTAAQGAWNIQYIPGDSLPVSLTGTEVRIDFRRNEDDKIGKSHVVNDIRKLLSRRDTVILIINKDSVQLMEQWKLYVDHGVLGEQYLVYVGSEPRRMVTINELYVIAVDSNTMTLGARIYDKEKKQRMQTIVIPRAIIKGVLINRRQ